MNCMHCGKQVEQGKFPFSRWFHSGRTVADTSRRCEPGDPLSTLAFPAPRHRKGDAPPK